jgi:acyl-ACP thioesterase
VVRVNGIVRAAARLPSDRVSLTSDDLVPPPEQGRVFESGRRVRLGDVSPAGRLRLDAAARYLQDLSSDDTTDASLVDADSWVVRRTWIEVAAFPAFREWLDMATWCSGTGGHWAERRVSLHGDRGGRVEAAVLWVHVDEASGRPRRVPPSFHDLYGEAAGGRTVKARPRHPSAIPADAAARAWPLRFTDFDLLQHVNNAAYWVPVEEALAERRDLRAPLRAEIEYRGGLDRGAQPEVAVLDRAADGLAMWIREADRLAATVEVRPL